MPFDVIGSIQRYDNYFTTLDYIIVRLWDGNDDGSDGQEYCIKNKGDEGVSYNTDCSDAYDIVPHNQRTAIGDLFKIRWLFEDGYSKLFIDVVGNACERDLVIISQTAAHNEEAVEIRVSDCYKAFTCGMCGNFYNTGLDFQRSDGSVIQLDEGCWGGTANDADGLSYLVDAAGAVTAHELHRRLVVDEYAEESEPCFGLRDEIIRECSSQMGELYAQCCWDRSQFCQEMIISCSWDTCSCVMGKGEAHKNTSTPQCVESILNASMSFMCGLDADSVLVPDMSIYQVVEVNNNNVAADSSECDKMNSGVNVVGVFVGVAIASAIFIILACLWYSFVIKPKLGMAQFQATKEAIFEGAV
jgi:hypothetical protein